MRDRDTQWLDDEDVIRLLEVEVERAGGQTAFARLSGLNRNYLNQILGGRRPIACNQDEFPVPSDALQSRPCTGTQSDHLVLPAPA